MAAGDASSTFTIEVEVDATNAQRSAASFFSTLRGSTTGLDTEINKLEKGMSGAGNATQKLTQNLSTSRYALYDVSTTLGALGTVLLGAAVATSAVAIAWERDFAQVVRTTGVTGDAVGQLRGELVDLAQTMPVAFGDLAQIATLAGQLGVAEDRVASFTQTVAKFSAVTDLTVEAAATAFGRLDALLPDVQGNYEALGSSIALVGVNSVATESQIVNISTQISSMGAFAGLTADQVVGLSGALASVGAAPELSRGTTTRLFTEMSEAVSKGGEKLEGFAKIAGVSSAEFAAAFGTDKFGPIFQSFIEGLDDTARNGGNAVAALDELGITSVRDVPLLLRLAGAGDLLGESFNDAAEGFRNATELNRQYGIIADTAAAQIQRMINSMLSLFDAIGGASLGPVTDAISFLADAFANLADFASTDIGGRILGIIAALGAFAGVLAIAGGAVALFGASSIGMQQGLAAIATLAPRATSAVLGAGTASAIASGQMSAAAVSAKVLGTALKAISLIGLVLVLPDLANWADDGIRGLMGISNEFDAMRSRFLDTDLFFGQDITEMDASFQAVGRALGDIANRGFGDIRRMDEELSRLAKSGSIAEARSEYESLRDTWVGAGGDVKGFEAAFIDATAALQGSRNAVSDADSGMAHLEEGLQAVEAEAQASEDAINDLRDAILNFSETSISAEEAEIAFKRGLQELQAGIEDAEAGLDGANGASLDFIQSMIDMDGAARQSAVAVLENGGEIEEAMGKYYAARDAIVAARMAKGEDEGAARAWADRVLGTAAEAESAIRDYSGAVGSVPGYKNTTLDNNAGSATLAVDAYRRALYNIPGYRETIINQVWRETGARLAEVRAAYATGGPVFGPGTGTSDSIPAYLSNGEYVIRAAAVQKYGMNFLNAINSARVPKFASGGPVSGSNVSAGAAMSSVVELGPKSLARIGQQAAVNIMLDEVGLARAVERGNQTRRAMGD